LDCLVFAQYKKYVLIYHPDKGGTDEKFMLIAKTYKHLLVNHKDYKKELIDTLVNLDAVICVQQNLLSGEEVWY